MVLLRPQVECILYNAGIILHYLERNPTKTSIIYINVAKSNLFREINKFSSSDKIFNESLKIYNHTLPVMTISFGFAKLYGSSHSITCLYKVRIFLNSNPMQTASPWLGVFMAFKTKNLKIFFFFLKIKKFFWIKIEVWIKITGIYEYFKLWFPISEFYSIR